MSTDRELLQRYLRDDDQAAFAELVKNHVGLVYSLAYRSLGQDADLAQDASQAVFTLLAAKPPPLSRAVSLSGWLYRATQNTVLHIRRKEFRRQNYETKAFDMNALLTNAETPGTAQLPEALISGALDTLNEDDREAVLMRFFQSRSFAAIGATLSISEDAARLRVERALGKIRRTFSARGVTSSIAAVEAALANQVIEAPAGLATAIADGVSAGRIALAVAGKKIGLFSLPVASSIAWLVGAAAAGAISVWVLQHHWSDPAHHADVSVGAKNGNVENLKSGESDTASAVESAASHTVAQIPPITGVVKMMRNGQEFDQRVEFIVGKETRFEGENCYFLVLPTMTGKQQILYTVKQMADSGDGGPPRQTAITHAQSFPSKGFKFKSLTESFTFVPDATERQNQ